METHKPEAQSLDLHTLEPCNSVTTLQNQNAQIQAGFDRDRNALVFGFTPQAELWNGRLAMLGFAIFVIWEVGYSLLQDFL